MGQTWYDDVYHINKNAGTTLEQIESDFLTLKSMFSGTTAPTTGTLYAGHPWFDTTNNLLRIRNNAGTWFGVMYGDSGSPIWMYVNSAPNGWQAAASQPSDKVLGFKGGSVYTTGGTTLGSWTTVYAHTHSHNHTFVHNHQWYDNKGDYQDCKIYDVNGNEVSPGYDNLVDYIEGGNYHIIQSGYAYKIYTDYDWSYGDRTFQDAYTKKTSTEVTSTSGATGSGAGTWRPYAAVGLLVYPKAV